MTKKVQEPHEKGPLTQQMSPLWIEQLLCSKLLAHVFYGSKLERRMVVDLIWGSMFHP